MIHPLCTAIHISKDINVNTYCEYSLVVCLFVCLFVAFVLESKVVHVSRFTFGGLLSSLWLWVGCGDDDESRVYDCCASFGTSVSFSPMITFLA